MKVILRERVKSLGNVGDMVSVSQGYARNFLIPNRLAVIADEQNQRFVEDQQRRLAKKIGDQKGSALELRQKINEVSIELTKRVAGNGKLFGAVTATDLIHELKAHGIDAEKRWFHFENPLKELGSFKVKMKIFSDVEADLSVKVLMDPKQIEENKAKTEQRKRDKKAQDEAKARAEAEAAAAAAAGPSEEEV